MKKHVQTDSEWQEEMSQKIIDEIQCELYLDMPFMKLALSALSPKANEQLYSMATDGTYIYYNPIRLIDIFKKNGMYLNRAYLRLDALEAELGMFARFRELGDSVARCLHHLDMVKASEETKIHLVQAQSILRSHMDEEEA